LGFVPVIYLFIFLITRFVTIAACCESIWLSRQEGNTKPYQIIKMRCA